jgi:hypothetical protein
MRSFGIPSHVGKSPTDFLAIEELDAAGYFFKSMAWLDYFERSPSFSPLLYACVDGRQGIEYLLFQELVLSTGAKLSEEDYLRCVNEPTRFIKTIQQLSPDYALLKRFTKIVASLDAGVPQLIDWDLGALMRNWGNLSEYLHWVGVRGRTTEDSGWLDKAHKKVSTIVKPIWICIWICITSGQSSLLHPDDMHPRAMEVWKRFKQGEIDEHGVKFQLQVLRPA